MDIADAQALSSPSGTYLNTASYGLPPAPAWEALQAALEDWRGGRTSWEHWDVPGEEARASFARLVGVAPETIAIAANVSTLTGLVAALIPDGSRVLAPDVEFTTVLSPFMAQEHREPRRRRRRVQRRALATGEVAPLDAIATAVRAHDVGLANRFRRDSGTSRPTRRSSSATSRGAADKLERAGIQAAVRGGRPCRLSHDSVGAIIRASRTGGGRD